MEKTTGTDHLLFLFLTFLPIDIARARFAPSLKKKKKKYKRRWNVVYDPKSKRYPEGKPHKR
jgi:hypothetical protein